jgi:aminopeptidase YwaD
VIKVQKYQFMNQTLLAGIFFVQFLVSSCHGGRYTTKISESELYGHIQYLASDALLGRFPGSQGDIAADQYIKERFDALKLENYHQEFSFLQALVPGSGNAMEIDGHKLPEGSFAPFTFSKDTALNGLVVFAGYGITLKTDSFSWNDYAGLHVKNKLVMALRGSPSAPGYEDYLDLVSEDRDKAMLASENGALGLILVSGYRYDSIDRIQIPDIKQAEVNIPCFQMLRAYADTLMRASHTSICEVEKAIAADKKTRSFETSAMVIACSDVQHIMAKTGNRYALIAGSDSILKNQYIIIGAHYDHIGMGGPGSSSRVPGVVAVHNGADDNASGVAVMLELAAKLTRDRSLLKRSVILVAFGGEEMGLLGSKYFVNHLPVELSAVTCMINLDMVGRLDTARGLQIGGAGTSLQSDSLIRLANSDHLRLKITPEGSGPSDHSSFYSRNIPVFFITTGAHQDYHTPDDDIEKINFKGLNAIAGFTDRLAMSVANDQVRLVFREAGPKEAEVTSHRFKVTLGFMPDFSATDIAGVRVDIVSKGKAAERGGIMNGDIITALNGVKINNLYDYMYRLSKLRKNQIVGVEILRNGVKEVLLIQL